MTTLGGAALVLALGGVMPLHSAGASPTPSFVAFTVSERGQDGANLLSRIDPDGVDPASNETDVGPTGTWDIEAMAMQPGTERIFAVNGGELGHISPVDGHFAALGPAVGAGEGAAGAVEFDDIDGLTFDPTTGLLYGSQRRESEPDLLLRIDPETGSVVRQALGGADYVAIGAAEGLHDIGDLAVEPGSGTMYGVANIYGGDRDVLITIDKGTGDTEVIGDLGTHDVQGLCFSALQRLHATTGSFGEQPWGLWDVDLATGRAGNLRELDNGRDYEAVACSFVSAAAPVDEVAPVPAPVPVPADDTPVRSAIVNPPTPVVLGELPATGSGVAQVLALALMVSGLGVMLTGDNRPRPRRRRR